MTALLATLATMIPNIMMGILANVLTKTLLQAIIEKLLIVLIIQAANLTTNVLTHECADLVIQAIQTPQNAQETPQTSVQGVNNG